MMCHWWRSTLVSEKNELKVQYPARDDHGFAHSLGLYVSEKNELKGLIPRILTKPFSWVSEKNELKGQLSHLLLKHKKRYQKRMNWKRLLDCLSSQSLFR